jgi:hypothetical protein
MGEAKRRGTFEERKAQAIAEGREKKQPTQQRKPAGYVSPELALMSALAEMIGIRRQLPVFIFLGLGCLGVLALFLCPGSRG